MTNAKERRDEDRAPSLERHDELLTSETQWARFGEFPSGNRDQPDPQRAVDTSCMFRAGSSALLVVGENGIIESTE